MLLAAQASGFALAYLELRDLLLRDGVAFGRTRALTVRPDPAGWFTLGEPAIEPLAALDCILMRKDPPFDTEYIYSTYILERAESAGVLIVNRPQGLRDMNEKVYTAWFPQCCAPTLITRDMGPALAAQGMLFVGLDVIGGFVTEINVTSPTGIRELDKQCGTRIGELLIAAVERHLAARPRRANLAAAAAGG